MNGIYQLPFGPGKPLANSDGAMSKFVGGWQLSGFMTARTGLPVNHRRIPYRIPTS